MSEHRTGIEVPHVEESYFRVRRWLPLNLFIAAVLVAAVMLLSAGVLSFAAGVDWSASIWTAISYAVLCALFAGIIFVRARARLRPRAYFISWLMAASAISFFATSVASGTLEYMYPRNGLEGRPFVESLIASIKVSLFFGTFGFVLSVPALLLSSFVAAWLLMKTCLEKNAQSDGN